MHCLNRLLWSEPRHWPRGQHGSASFPSTTPHITPAHSQLFLTTPPAAVQEPLGALWWTHRRPEPCVWRGLSVRKSLWTNSARHQHPTTDRQGQPEASHAPSGTAPPTRMPTSSTVCWLHGDTLNTLSPQDPAPSSPLSARSWPRPHQLTRLPGADPDESLSRLQLHGGHGHCPRPHD